MPIRAKGINRVCYAAVLAVASSLYAAERSSPSEENSLRHQHADGPHEGAAAAKDATGKAQPQEIESYRVYLGKVEADPNKSSHLNPRYPGVVRSVLKSIGDSVAPGETLALIDSNVGVQTYPLKANVKGKIIHRKLSVGEFVDEDRLAFSIANLDTMWVNLTIRQSELKHFKNNQEVIVVSRDKSYHSVGKIFFISPIVDEHTMTASATIEVDNKDRTWKPGQYVDGYVVAGKTKAPVAVPNEAIISLDGKPTIYIQGEGGKIETRIVATGKNDLHFTEVTRGLSAGDQFYLKPSRVRDLAETEHHEEGDHGHSEGTHGDANDSHDDEGEGHQHSDGHDTEKEGE